MLFSSLRPGGFGGWDIYVSNFVSGEWSAPRNLGSPLNTQGNEVTPFYDGNNLYFSSDWHKGLGGLDVFRAELGAEEIKNIYHLGPIVNSSYDDYGFIYNAEQRLGYLTSNRPGGRGNEDIWQVAKKTADPAPTAYSDMPFGKNNPTTPAQYNTPPGGNTYGYYSGTIYDGYSSAPMPDAVVYAQSIGSNQVLQTKTDNGGHYQLYLSPYQEYTVTYAQTGYNDVRTTVKTDRMIQGSNELPEVELRAGSSDLIAWLAQNGKTPTASTTDPLKTGAASDLDPGHANGFAIQLASGPHDFADAYTRYPDLTPYGNLYTRQEGSKNKLRLGVYATRNEADEVVSQISQRYNGAFTVVEPNVSQELFVKTAAAQPEAKPAQYSTDGPKKVAPYNPSAPATPTEYSTPTTPAASSVSLISPKKVEVVKTENTPGPLTGYSIQVASSPDGLKPAELTAHESLSKHGNLYTKQEDGLTKLRLGIFTTRIKAQEAMKQVSKNMRYKNAFVVEEYGADDALVLRDAAEAAAVQPPAQYAVKTPPSVPASAPNLNSPIRYAVQVGSFSPDKSIKMSDFS
ncbi:MAG TPA: SPOR domain-containing protein, partial [Saprospiraceae bacterium]|nr:SPOR domain-containing protein [Saprospiraceae bacterium]